MNATLPGASLKDFARVLSCFSRVGDEVALEVKPGKLQLSTINSSKSAFLLVTLNATRFEKFEYLPPRLAPRHRETDKDDEPLRCRLQIRALLSIFRPRNIENKDSRDAAVEKCELKLLHPSDDGAECQLLIRLVCKHGVRKTYKLQYEQTQTMHAVTDKTICHNRFSIAARAMKDVMDHFAPRAEELTLAVNDGNLLLTSFTEGIMNDKEVLKQPIHTSISIDNKEFESMEVDEQVQITFGLREFKALGTLCDLVGADLSIYYSAAGRPLLVDFEKDGMTGEFVVATTADGERVSNNRAVQQSEAGPNPARQYQARTIRAGSERTAEADDFVVDRNLADSEWRDHSMMDVDQQRSGTHTSAALSRISRRDSSTPAQVPDRSALFMPNPDSQDPEVQVQQAALHAINDNMIDGDNSFADTGSGFTDMCRQPEPNEQGYEDEEMELYADELNFESGEEVIGPTQTQTRNRPKGLFD